MSQQDLAQTLAESFSALADEVQSLIDRKTILEHKLRFAHEQVCRHRFDGASLRFCYCLSFRSHHTPPAIA